MKGVYILICFVVLVWFGWICSSFTCGVAFFWVSDCVYTPVLKMTFSNGKSVSGMTSGCQNHIQQILFCSLQRYIGKIGIYPLVNWLTFKNKKPVLFYSNFRLCSVHNLIMADQKRGQNLSQVLLLISSTGLQIWSSSIHILNIS